MAFYLSRSRINSPGKAIYVESVYPNAKGFNDLRGEHMRKYVRAVHRVSSRYMNLRESYSMN